MRLLLTRPQSDDDPLPELLREAGHTGLAGPLLRIDFLPLLSQDAASLQAIIATSSNALRAVKGSPALQSLLRLPLFAIGTATAAAARDAGFNDVIEGPGTGSDLVPFMRARLQPGGGGVLYLRGEDIAFDMRPALAETGLLAIDAVVYRAIAAEKFSAATLTALTKGTLGGVVLLSPRTASIYAKLVQNSCLTAEVTEICHYCLSDRVAHPLAALGAVTTRAPSRPNLQELVALIGRGATQLPPSH